MDATFGRAPAKAFSTPMANLLRQTPQQQTAAPGGDRGWMRIWNKIFRHPNENNLSFGTQSRKMGAIRHIFPRS